MNELVIGIILISISFWLCNIYINHCWNCHHSICSLFCERCPICGWYICNECGSCSSKLCGRFELDKMKNDSHFYKLNYVKINQLYHYSKHNQKLFNELKKDFYVNNELKEMRLNEKFYHKCSTEIDECYFQWNRDTMMEIYNILHQMWIRKLNLTIQEFMQLKKIEEIEQEEDRIRREKEIRDEKLAHARIIASRKFNRIDKQVNMLKDNLKNNCKVINIFYETKLDEKISEVYTNEYRELCEYIVKDGEAVAEKVTREDIIKSINVKFENIEKTIKKEYESQCLKIKELICSDREDKLKELNCFKILERHGNVLTLATENKIKVKASRCIIFDNYVRLAIYDEEGYDGEGYDLLGYDRNGYDDDGYNKLGYTKDGFDKEGYNKLGYARDGFNIQGYDEDGYDRNGFNDKGYDRRGFNKDGYYEVRRFDGKSWRTSLWTYDEYGYDKNGFNIRGEKMPDSYWKKKKK